MAAKYGEKFSAEQEATFVRERPVAACVDETSKNQAGVCCGFKGSKSIPPI